MLSETNSRRSAAAILLALMFLSADLLVAQSNHNFEDFEDENITSNTPVRPTFIGETYISNIDSNFDFSGQPTNLIGVNSSNEARGMYGFLNIITAVQTVESATLNLHCSVVDGSPINQIKSYSSNIFRDWRAGEATWFNANFSTFWQQSGGDGSNDRSQWEPPATYTQVGSTGIYKVSYNVTHLVQQSAINFEQSFDFIISSVGGMLDCEKANNQNLTYEPELILIVNSLSPGDGGSVESNFASNNTALMSPNFILQPQTTPTISYQNLNGSGVEFQFSLSEDFRDVSDLDWLYSTMNNAFTGNSTSGSFTIPNQDSINPGGYVYYRYRSIDSTSMSSNWLAGNFILPDLQTTNNNDGTATLILNSAVLNTMGFKLIEDVEVNSALVNSNLGGNNIATISPSLSAESLVHTRLNIDKLGLHSNSTILDANLVLTRSSTFGGNVVLSIHENSIDSWLESQASWRNSNTLEQWVEGGMYGLEASQMTNLDSTQVDSVFEFSFKNLLQEELDSGFEDPIELSIVGRVPGESHSTGTNTVSFYTSEIGTMTNEPYVEITYSWTSNSTIDVPEQIYPLDGHPVWNQSGHNLSGNTTPVLEWNSSSVSSYNYIFEVSNDEYFRDIITSFDTGKVFYPINYFDFGVNTPLDTGNMYHWRMINYDNDNRFGSYAESSFLVSSLSSTWLGGDNYQMTLSQGIESGEEIIPSCQDSSLLSYAPNFNDFGSPYIQIQDDPTIGQIVGIFQCDLTNYVLPQGYAVTSSSLELTLDSLTNPGDVGLWEGNNHNWSGSEVTWNSYDGDNSWDIPGVGGSDRGQLLDVQNIPNTALQGDKFTWNITSATQFALREMRPVDFILDIPQSASTSSNFFRFNSNYNGANNPELSFIYVPGSNQLPSIPILESPVNGEWLYETGFTLENIQDPTFEWNTSSNSQIVGWAIDIDTSDTFSSPGLQSYTSWNDPGFDMVNSEFELSNDLDEGKKWYWRVRGLSSTYQLGDWSATSHFFIPDNDFTLIDQDHMSQVLRHNEVLPDVSLPHFEDTYIVDEDVQFQPNHKSELEVLVGTTNTGYNSSGLYRMSIDAELQPFNSRVISAHLHLYSNPSLSTVGESIAVREILQPWTVDGNHSSYNGNNNSSWSQVGGRGIGTDIGSILDIQQSSLGWMEWNVTYAVQQAISSGTNSLSVMLYSTIDTYDRMVHFSSVDASTNRPYLELIWANGSSPVSQDYPINDLPADNSISWDTSSHALIADKSPTFEWSLPSSISFNPDAWRVFIDNDLNDEMAGQIVYDSRLNPSYFDLVNLEFYPPIDLDFSNHIQWSVQGIENGMIGYTSNKTSYWIPNEISEELDSTDAVVELQDGTIVSELSYPLITSDTYLDEGDPTNSKNGQGLYVGTSPSNTNAISSSLVSFDFSSLPLPSAYDVISAYLVLTEISNSSGLEEFYCSSMITDWDESSTWNSPSSSSNWVAPGAFHSSDSELPIIHNYFDTEVDEKKCDITTILQKSIFNGDENLSVILQPEYDSNGAIQGQFHFADSENSNVDYRPKLVIEYRDTNPWIPIAPILSSPLDGATLWNYSSPLPQNVDQIDYSLTQTNTNATDWEFCFSYDQRLFNCIDSVTETIDLPENFSWDSFSNTLSFNDSSGIDSMATDSWLYWKMLAKQDYRIGDYSTTFKYRIPSDLGSSDGTGNYTYELSRASIFESTGVLPEVLDASIDANNLVNTGQDNLLRLGYDPSTGGNSDILLDFDLSNIPWPNAITPTSMILELNLQSAGQSTSPLTVSAFACSSFSEQTVTAASAPLCSTTEITRTTITPSNSGVVQWDLTSLGQANLASGNLSFTIILDAANVSSGYDFHTSEGPENLQPKLVLEYVDNVGGIIPPSQPALTSPSDGSVLYDTTGETISSVNSVTLSWAASTGATAYILSLSNSTSIVTYDSRIDSEIVGNTFTSSSSLEVGEVYSWWVQAINQTIPGPSSSRWSFALGDPTHYFNNDGTYVYEIQDAAEVIEYGHVEVRDSTITDGFADSNYGSDDTITLGTGCNDVAGSLCYGLISLDASQIPLNQTQSVHSIDLTLFVESWDLSGGAYQIEFSVHEFLDTSWTEYGITWNTTGVNPGLTAGVDYDINPLDVQTYTSTDSQLNFQIAMQGMQIDDERHWIVIANPISSGTVLDGLVNVYSSDANANKNQKPLFEFHTTNTSSLNITTSATTFDADTPIVFDVQSFDQFGNLNHPSVPLGGTIEWSTTSGVISVLNTSRISLNPSFSGLQTISACYGVICTDYVIDISPGIPVTLVASLNSTNSMFSQTITADETAEIYSYVLDQYGNIVTSEIINYFSTNGSMGGVNGAVFSPYSVGVQTLTAQWTGVSTSLSVDLTVTVTPGAPDTIFIEGCQNILASGTSCPVYATVYDQHNNLVWFDDVGSYSFSTTNGNFVKVQTNTPHSQPPQPNILVGDYTGVSIGNWTVTISTSTGLTDSIDVEVTYGEIASLELVASSNAITADELLEINATRIDVNGNRLPVIIPLENWTSVADGILTPGITHTWEPTFQGTKTIIASYEGFSENVSVFVSRGSIEELQILVNEVVSNGWTFNLTADQTIDAEIRAYDAKGNVWYPQVDWTIEHPQWANLTELSKTSNSTETRFSPVHESGNAYSIKASYTEDGNIYIEEISVMVSTGDLENFIISAIDFNGFTSNDLNNQFTITADEWVSFSSQLSDSDGNSIDSNIITWILVDLSNGEETDITSQLELNSMRWDASESGNWQIYAYAVNQRTQNLTESFNIDVNNGNALYVEIEASADSQDAGDEVSLIVYGFDSDGNKFPQVVDWKENGGLPYNINSTSSEAEYIFNGRVSGNYTLSATFGASTDTVNVIVLSLSSPKYIDVNVSKTTLEQLESLSISVTAYDEYWNIIDIPASTSRLDATGRGDVTYKGQGVWNIETLDEGKQTATITIGSVSQQVNYTVEGNIAGFFAAGGSLYYVGAGMIILIALAILAVGFRFIRRERDYYDDEEDDYEFDYDVDEVISTPATATPQVAMPPARPPTKPEPISQPEPEEPEEETQDDWMIDYRVEDDGTEWGQADDETWYYREAGQSEWVEWTE